MTNVTITRHFSGFQNVADTVSTGNFEADGNAATSTYELPAGYSFDEVSGRIFDSADIECAVIAECSNIILISRAGLCADVILKEI